jgi:hypothetical protein
MFGSPGIFTRVPLASLRPLLLFLGYGCPFPLHRIPIKRCSIDSETFLLKASEGSLDIAVILVTKVCHCHAANEVGDIGQLAFVAIAERRKGV